MRRLLISAAAMAVLAAPMLFSSALGQPGHDRGGPAQGGQPHQGQPQQGGGHERGGGRGGNRGAAQAPAAAAPAMNHGNGQGHRAAGPAGAPAAMAPPQATNRGNFQGQRGQNNGHDFNRPGNRPDNRPGSNFNNRPGGTSFGNRPGGNRPNNFQGNNRGAGNPGIGGPRHDFSNFRDFHRTFNASRRFQAPAYRRPAGWYAHRWSFGEFLPSAFWARDYWLIDFAAYGLPPPPYGAVWVRVGNDALLVDEDSGEVITVEYGVFY